MKTIRKSLNKDSIRTQISTPMPLPSVSKPNAAVVPPQKVIKALNDYRPNAPQELSFKKGDFFYVINEFEDGSYYEAHNPVTGARGLVVKNLFEEFKKTSARSVSLDSPQNSSLILLFSVRTSQASLPSPTNLAPTPKSPPTKSHVFYAVVLHDFDAERPDELDAKRGDAITVVAQSNREWFVAKPIGKLGRPGLIPVSFVEIHDPTTGKPIHDVESLMDAGDLPKVEDWKRAMFTYKQNSIPLGVLDSPPATTSGHTISVQDPSPQNPLYAQPQSPPRNPSPDCLPEGIILSGSVVSFHFEMEEYWFRIDALFQPYAPPGQSKLPPAKQLVLFRVYNDFYDFQVRLLDTFPREAGRQPPHPRMLPYMPGPAQNVDHALTATRRLELDEYLHNLCDLSKVGATYILEHRVVREFLALKPGDVDSAAEPRVKEMEAIFKTDFSSSHDAPRPTAAASTYDVDRSMSSLKLRDEDVSEYEDEGYAPSPQRQTYERHPYSQASTSNDNLRLHAHVKSHQRSGSNSSIQQHPYTSNSRSNSPVPRSSSPLANNDYVSQPRWNSNHSANSLSTSSVRSNSGSGGRSRSQSTTTNNFNSPTISAANPQTAFVKIKIFDRVADDLVAIRVHPRVSHAELMEKVQTRLGGEVSNLRYRDSVSNSFVGLSSDQDLRLWMESTDKYVLYAD